MNGNVPGMIFNFFYMWQAADAYVKGKQDVAVKLINEVALSLLAFLFSDYFRASVILSHIFPSVHLIFC